jgi:hypothetical protein
MWLQFLRNWEHFPTKPGSRPKFIFRFQMKIQNNTSEVTVVSVPAIAKLRWQE